MAKGPRRSSLLLAVGLLVSAPALLGHLQNTFATPSARRAALLGGIAAATAGLVQEPAEAVTAKFGFFGFGGGQSDAYNQVDNDAYTPYSQFSNGIDKPEDNLYKPNADIYLQRKRKYIDENVERIEKLIPKYIKEKDFQNIKAVLTLKGGNLGPSIEYFTTGGAQFYNGGVGVTKTTPAWEKWLEAKQSLADLLVISSQKRWDEAAEEYKKSMKLLNEWKVLAKY